MNPKIKELVVSVLASKNIPVENYDVDEIVNRLLEKIKQAPDEITNEYVVQLLEQIVYEVDSQKEEIPNKIEGVEKIKENIKKLLTKKKS